MSSFVQQPSLPGMCPIATALEELASTGNVAERGAIYTRREVVDFILDLAGYTTDQPLYKLRLLEPSFGNGDFLFPIIDRLLASWKTIEKTPGAMKALGRCIHAVELHHPTFIHTQARVIARLIGAGIPASSAESIAGEWLHQGDFLLIHLPEPFDMVVGNPPYVRQELIPDVLLAEYRNRYETIYDRADLYVPFIERSLKSIGKDGTLGFICADRWMKNRYGGPLRALIANEFHLKVHVDMTGTQAFHADVNAYPAIVVIKRQKGGGTRLASQPDINREALTELAASLLQKRPSSQAHAVWELSNIASGVDPWILDSSQQTLLVRRLEASFPALEDAGCKVGIGVATGADHAFIGSFDSLDVEEDRKLPLVMPKDILDGTVKWQGLGVINPFLEEGGLVDLTNFPRLKRYLEARKEKIAARHCVRKNPANWYKTIDRIHPSLTKAPKLLIPDIKGKAHIVYEEGAFYPHHNLYFITSDEWDLRALQAILLSGIARLFVATYSTRMRGGFMRFQAQYLRRIRVPEWKDVSVPLRQQLITASTIGDLESCNRVAIRLYGLSEKEAACLVGPGDGDE